MDINKLAMRVVKAATEGEETENSRVVEISSGLPLKPKQKNEAAVSLGRLGGLKGGPARAKKLTPESLKSIAQRAAKQRWAKAKDGL